MDVNDHAGEEPDTGETPAGSGTSADAAPADLPSDPPSVIETVLYGPLGLVLEARTLMPRLVQRGRSEVAMAKMVGQFAVRKGTEDLAAGALVGQDKLLGVLRGTRMFGAGGSEPTAPRSTTPPSTTPPSTTSSTTGETTSDSGDTAAPPSPSRVSAHAAEQAAGIDPSDLAIMGYDLLSASQVVPRLESLTTSELELVARYEAGTRGRKTILAKVSQLQAATSPDQ